MSYVESQSIQKPNLFVESLYKAKCLDLAEKAFYLVEMVKENKTLPEKCSGNVLHSITDSVGKINDIELLDLIYKLIEICFSNGFKDEKFGLEYSLRKAVENLIQINPFNVKVILNELLQIHSDNEHLITFCNMNLERINEFDNRANDVPLNKEEAKIFLIAFRKR